MIKLGPDDQDILLNKGIRTFLNVGSINLVEFLIESGNARWPILCSLQNLGVESHL